MAAFMRVRCWVGRIRCMRILGASFSGGVISRGLWISFLGLRGNLGEPLFPQKYDVVWFYSANVDGGPVGFRGIRLVW